MLGSTAVFQEIAAQIQIQSDFTLQHPDYPDWPVPEIVAARLQASSREIQAKFLCTQLQAYLHCLYFSRSLVPLTTPPSLGTSPHTIDNSSVRGVDTAFFAQIEQANCGRGYYDPHWIVQKIMADDLVAVVKDGLCLQVQPTEIHPDQRPGNVGEPVAIRLPKNLLTVDRYIAVGNQGRVQQSSLVHLYFNCSPTTAIALMTQITADFNHLELPFELQILLHLDEYPHADALFLKWAATDYDTAYPYLATLWETYQSEFYDPIPAFTQPLGRGVGKAVTASGQNFPQQIWQLVAQALAAAWLQEITDVAAKVNGIQQKLQAANLDNGCV